jgi:hypothetical protein
VGVGVVSDTPVNASVTTLPVAATLDWEVDAAAEDAVAPAEGVAGLWLHATVAAMSTSVLMTMAVFFFIGSYRKKMYETLGS